MNFRLANVLPLAIFLTAGLYAPSASAQGRGMRGARRAGHEGASFRSSGREGVGRPIERRDLNESGLLFAPYFYSDEEYDSAHFLPAGFPVQVIVEQPAAAPVAPSVPATPPADALVLEKREGQWVRVPNGRQTPTAAQSTGKQESSLAAKPHPGIADPAAGIKPTPELPAAVIVFRDGHKEELQKYMIQGDALYTSANSYTPGALTKRIPLSELDIPASLKLNNERGAKFNLPSASNEVVIRF